VQRKEEMVQRQEGRADFHRKTEDDKEGGGLYLRNGFNPGNYTKRREYRRNTKPKRSKEGFGVQRRKNSICSRGGGKKPAEEGARLYFAVKGGKTHRKGEETISISIPRGKLSISAEDTKHQAANPYKGKKDERSKGGLTILLPQKREKGRGHSSKGKHKSCHDFI